MEKGPANITSDRQHHDIISPVLQWAYKNNVPFVGANRQSEAICPSISHWSVKKWTMKLNEYSLEMVPEFTEPYKLQMYL